MDIINKLYLNFLKKIDRKKYASLVYSQRINHLIKQGVKIGENCRIENAKFGSEPYLITIGNHVTIGANVQFVTHDGGVWVLRDKYPDIDCFGRIEIKDNSFIGINAIIMPGVTIGKNTIIAAGSIVTKDVNDNTIVAGIPAKQINNISNYENKVLNSCLKTKSMNYKEKREYLLKHFEI
ncbi:acyltransferase [Domibacillus aminovorans]|uniref:Capsule biosynthesis protein CapG n=1 Tax=Domibacillus aminovorans TaxID=29332 RepID=A0A177L032_9BACI|nr:acyltransferase [Domibacillus aminovorans]OAH58963.1 hypothetical protein AWH49_04675 [Domibacillus aminovorans]